MRIRMGRRLLWLAVLATLAMSGLGARLWALQIKQGPAAARSLHQQRTLSLPLTGSRGLMLDRHGQPLSDPTAGWGVGLFPPLVSQPEAVARQLAPWVGIPEERLLARLEQAGREPFWLAVDLPAATAAAITQMNLPGVAVGPAGSRYGEGALARHLIGYINAQGGQLGLERLYEAELSGRAGPRLFAALDGQGRPLSQPAILPVQSATGSPPAQILTTLDWRIQRLVEEVLDQQRRPDGLPFRGAAVVMEAGSGEVLAMASRPHFRYGDLNAQLGGLKSQREVGASRSNLLNRAVTAYPPGSVIKPLIAAIALEQERVAPAERFDCPGHYTVGGHRFGDAGAKAHGSVSLTEALAVSCNVTFLRIGHERLGLDGLQEAARRFGLGRVTNLAGRGRDLPEEQPGRIPAGAAEGALQIAIGQGQMLVTPLQVARAYAAIANGGVLPPVRLVQLLRSPQGEVLERIRSEPAVRILTQETAALIRQGLLAVTDPGGGGTARLAWVEGGAAGKTGSAETGLTAAGGGESHAWFAGYLPAAEPRWVVVVLAEGGGSGGLVAAPIFAQIGRGLLGAPPQ